MAAEYDIKANIPKNRLYIRIKGFMTEEEAEIIGNRALEETKKLKPGFDVINDIRELKPATPTAAKIYAARAAESGKTYGVRHVIRVVGDRMTTHLQLDRLLKETVGIQGETAKTVEEAERMLDKP